MASKPLPALQESAMNSFLDQGFPDAGWEEWRFTRIQPITSSQFKEAGEVSLERGEIESMFPFVRGGSWIVIENGRLNHRASSADQPPGIRVKNLAGALDDRSVRETIGKQADIQHDAFTALNTAFLGNDAVAVVAGKGADPSRPLYLLHVSTAPETVCHNRLLVVAEANTGAAISLVTAATGDTSGAFNNSVIEVAIAENASLEFNLLQSDSQASYQICNAYVNQQRNSEFRIHTLTTGGRIIRNKLHIRSQGEGSHTRLYGLYLGNEDQLMDNHTAMFHQKPNCTSNQLYKGLVDDRARAVFNGKIIVERGAQKTAAYQSNKNILLGADAVVNAKPQLEIFADDVKCTHGATTGQLDEDALFYLRSRGLSAGDARAMLNMAFAFEILDSIADRGFREFVSALVESKLKKARS